MSTATIDLRQYWRSAHWQQVRLGALAAAGHRCSECGATHGLSVHHRSYDHLGTERPADLEVLCKRCHALRHGRQP